jgi:flavodoxin
MKSIVIYYSETGNTEKVARAIARGLGSECKKLNEIAPEKLFEFDLICFGTPVHGFAPAKPVKEFLEKLPNLAGKRGAGFCTMHAGGDRAALKIIKEVLEAKGISFLGGFSCKGLSRLVGNIGPRIFNPGKPDEKDLKEAEDFGARLRSSSFGAAK